MSLSPTPFPTVPSGNIALRSLLQQQHGNTRQQSCCCHDLLSTASIAKPQRDRERVMAEKLRPGLLEMDGTDFGGLSALQELDEFLDGEECSYDREYVESCVSLLQAPDLLGQACVECRRSTTPTLAAVSSGHAECLREMVSASCTLGGLDLLDVVGNENGASLSHVAARRGELDCLRVLLEAGGTGGSGLCEVGDSRGTTPLHVCANHGHVECLRCLLCEGRCGLQRNQDGATAIHFAAVSGHTECLKVLIEEGGGDPNEQTDSGETPGE